MQNMRLPNHLNFYTRDLFVKAKTFFDQNNLDEAIKYFQKLVEACPLEPSYHSHLGNALLRKGWTGYAEAEFKIALRFNPIDNHALNYFIAKNKLEEIKKKEIMMDKIIAKPVTQNKPLPKTGSLYGFKVFFARVVSLLFGGPNRYPNPAK